MGLLLLAFTLLGAVLVAVLAAASWLSRPLTDDDPAPSGRRLIDGALLGTLVLLASTLGAGAALVAAWILIALGGGPPRFPASVAVGVAAAGAAAGAAWVGAARLRSLKRGALPGMGVLGFAVVSGAGAALSPLAELGPWQRDMAALASAVLGAGLASAALLPPPRGDE